MNIAAGIDLGSNSFRLLIAEVKENHLIPLEKKLISVRLAQGLSRGGNLSDQAMCRAFDALSDFNLLLQKYNISSCRMCGTAALRNADNAALFISRATRITGCELTVLSGEEEALLSYQGAWGFPPGTDDNPRLYIDAGGGSTELVLDSHLDDSPCAISLNLGAVSVTEEFLLSDPPNPEELKKAAAHITRVLRQGFRILSFEKQNLTLLASGGTATALAALDLELEAYNEKLVQNHFLTSENLQRLEHRLTRLAAAERNRLPGLDKNRGEIIIAGLMIYQSIIDFIHAPGIIISDAGLLEGILLSGLKGDYCCFSR